MYSYWILLMLYLYLFQFSPTKYMMHIEFSMKTFNKLMILWNQIKVLDIKEKIQQK